MQKEKFDLIVLKKLNLPPKENPQLKEWKDFVNRIKNPNSVVRIGLVGKYVELHDSYKSINEAFVHAGA